MNLQKLISRSLSTPRTIRMGMRRQLKARPTSKLSYLPMVDHLSGAMMKGYRMAFRDAGVTLRRESAAAREAQYKQMAREVLKQYGSTANPELQRVYRNARAKGLSVKVSTGLMLGRFRTLGHAAPVTNRLEALYRSAIRSANQQGVFDSTRADAAVWGYRYIAREVRGQKHPTTRDSHWQYHGVTLEKEDPFWNTIWPPLEYGCYCKIKVFRRKQKVVKPPPRPIEIESQFKGQGFALS